MGSDRSEVLVGKVAGAYGVKGWLKVSSFTQPQENILAYTPWRLRDRQGTRNVELLEGRPHGKGLIVRLAEVGDRDQAEGFKGMEIVVTRDQLPEPEVGHYYWTDLEGLQVVARDGAELGVVDHMLEAGAADVMVVTGAARSLIPFVMNEVVLDVDLVGGRITVDWQPDEQD